MAHASMITVSSANRPLYLRSYSSSPVSRNMPVSAFMMLALCTIVDFLAAGRHGVLERELEQAPAALAGVDAGRHGDGVRIVVDLDVVLVADVQPFEILAHHHQIDVVEAAAGNRACAPDADWHTA